MRKKVIGAPLGWWPWRLSLRHAAVHRRPPRARAARQRPALRPPPRPARAHRDGPEDRQDRRRDRADQRQGFTLYWFVPDTATKSNCNGACATYWPPVKAQRLRAPASPARSPRSRARTARCRPPTTGIRCTPTSVTPHRARRRATAQPVRRCVARGDRLRQRGAGPEPVIGLRWRRVLSGPVTAAAGGACGGGAAAASHARTGTARTPAGRRRAAGRDGCDSP